MPRHKDEADWSGVKLESVNVAGGKPNPQFIHNGNCYVTEGEWLLAQALDAQGVPFTPNVRFVLKPSKTARGERTPRDSIYVPDFIFNKQAYIWTDPDTGEEELIHGLEAKGSRRRQGHGYRKINLLWQSRRIRVKLLSAPDIKRLIAAGGLPLRPYRP